jgi:hypothetical protein
MPIQDNRSFASRIPQQHGCDVPVCSNFFTSNIMLQLTLLVKQGQMRGHVLQDEAKATNLMAVPVQEGSGDVVKQGRAKRSMASLIGGVLAATAGVIILAVILCCLRRKLRLGHKAGQSSDPLRSVCSCKGTFATCSLNAVLQCTSMYACMYTLWPCNYVFFCQSSSYF